MEKFWLLVITTLVHQSIIGAEGFHCYTCHYSVGPEKREELPRDATCRDGAQPKQSLLQDCRKIEENHAAGHCKLSNTTDDFGQRNLANKNDSDPEPIIYGCMTLHGFESKSSNNIWSERGCVILRGVEIEQEADSCGTYPVAKWRGDSSSSTWATCVSLKGLGLDDRDSITACYYTKDQGSTGDTSNANSSRFDNYCLFSLVANFCLTLIMVSIQIVR